MSLTLADALKNKRQRALDYFSGDEYDEDFLPWPQGDHGEWLKRSDAKPDA